MKDHKGQAIFFHDALRYAAVKLLALKAGWQAMKLADSGHPVIIFIDEPALAGYGSSEFISISREDVMTCLQEVIAAIQSQGALAGVHVCANTDWSLLMDSAVDIINFDAHGYFDKFALYGQDLAKFLQAGRILAWCRRWILRRLKTPLWKIFGRIGAKKGKLSVSWVFPSRPCATNP